LFLHGCLDTLQVQDHPDTSAARRASSPLRAMMLAQKLTLWKMSFSEKSDLFDGLWDSLGV
jgi:hypothetical protein